MKNLSFIQIGMILMTIFALSAGQIMFKLASHQLGDMRSAIHSLIGGWLGLSLIVYAVATVLWVLVLRGVELRQAYPFASLAFFLVPLLAHFALGESLNGKTFIGAAIIIFGVWVSVN